MKNSVVKIILDMLLPYYCRGCGRTGSLLCEECRAEIEIIGEISERTAGGKAAPRRAKGVTSERIMKEVVLGDLRALFVGGFREGALEKLVKDYKFKSVKEISEILVSILDEAVPKKFSGECLGEIIVVPLPTIKKHIRERGFDHTKRLAKEFAEKCGIECQEILKRVNKTVQVGADEETREKQAEEAYAVDFSKAGLEEQEGAGETMRLNPEKFYLLLDDVWTTGASMRAAAKKLREAGAKKIYGAVIEIGR